MEPAPTFREAFAAFAKIGALSFGGPAGQIALMHRTVVDERRWLTEDQFLNALNFCMLLPGPEAMQLATYVGWRLHGIAGGLAAGLLFVLPGAAVVLALSAIYVAFGDVPLVDALFVGVQAAVLIIVIDALLKIAKRALRGPLDWLIAAAAFLAIFALQVPFPLIIAGAAVLGIIAASQRADPGLPASPQTHAPGSEPADATSQGVAAAPSRAGPSWTSAARTAATWLVIWLAPLAALWFALGSEHVLVQLGLFFSKLAVVTFGGAYAVLAYMVQEVSQNFGWLSAQEMLDGLGLAETTPGPLILVTQFVGYLAGARADGALHDPVMGLAAVAVTLWMTFAPCFLWIFSGAPFVAGLQEMPRVRAALAGVTAAVVGVILNLSVWFGLNVLFVDVETTRVGPVSVLTPQLSSIEPVTAGLTILAAVLLLGARFGIVLTLAICAAASLASTLVPALL
ncbi:MAG: chromate efflux transporter [Pseudomonadota bacterium]